MLNASGGEKCRLMTDKMPPAPNIGRLVIRPVTVIPDNVVPGAEVKFQVYSPLTVECQVDQVPNLCRYSREKWTVVLWIDIDATFSHRPALF